MIRSFLGSATALLFEDLPVRVLVPSNVPRGGGFCTCIAPGGWKIREFRRVIDWKL